jgi:hypothetical protein
LLITITINVVRSYKRKARVLRHGGGMTRRESVALDTIEYFDNNPVHQVEVVEEVNRIRSLLSEEEWNLAWDRASGKSWQQIGEEHGRSPEALRKELGRARARLEQNSIQASLSMSRPGGNCLSAPGSRQTTSGDSASTKRESEHLFSGGGDKGGTPGAFSGYQEDSGQKDKTREDL